MDKQFICDKASECSCLWCEHRIAHKTFLDETECCNHAGFVNCVKGSVCVPVASQSAPSLYDALSTNSQPETERGTSDPDAAAAREYVKSATINNVEAGVYELDALLLRLADKVEGK